MEILSNFASIYCYISFVIGAILMFVSLAIVAMSKDNESRNNVRFFVEKNSDNLELLMEDKNGYHLIIGTGTMFWRVKLQKDDFADMKEGEIREVFINLED